MIRCRQVVGVVGLLLTRSRRFDLEDANPLHAIRTGDWLLGLGFGKNLIVKIQINLHPCHKKTLTIEEKTSAIRIENTLHERCPAQI